ncbi:hypothetical protein LTR91_001512 [Friedmanniomyces endolithicus]|uniref:RRM domain-containing protein n=1 Tax=Friedmanniomyces endolithicus TaxID=329885 RepID=A0AAN6G156_9PEZI|nr:hypothetical protein LTR82_001384 [Friedmanniomyces endolithicus]KAK0923627.1 hypothetical protein LTR57_006560 [Friedmanniomyces endolithicus]KAK0947955.1 hypothetical protein LTR29_000478 [Friedmanniomyces endolithicus]KAK0977964.1 hypothetical protein LTS01_012932 [Friedmanniomyces endolithicus]KAK1013201.1 hypothetical protein LTR91_001512 [Friedmanniomyces endolithicus]
MSTASRQKATLFIGGLDPQVSQQTLHDAFLPFGEIVDISLPKPEHPSNTDPHRGFGYVEFALPEDAREAIDNMHQAELYGRTIRVNAAKERKDASQQLGARTAVWEQEGYAAKYGAGEGEGNEDGDGEVNGGEGQKPEDPMQGLEGLAEAGPRER